MARRKKTGKSSKPKTVLRLPDLAPYDLRRTSRLVVPSCGWQVGADSVSSRPRVRPNHRALSRVQAEAPARC